jgi:ABC-type sugar transport system ATPase subunit
MGLALKRKKKRKREHRAMADVKVVNLTKRYGRYTAVDNISFSCKDGEFFSILGPSGAGKTTTLELLAGIKKPDSGGIYIGDRLVNDLPPQERDVAMAFENYSLYPHFSVYENIAFPLRAPSKQEKLSPGEERSKVEEIATLLGIEDLLDRRPQHLSGGQRQRVSLARAMIRVPKVYLLDEPISHLDAKLKVSARTTLKKLANKLRITIIYVTHDYREALGLSDRIMTLNKGVNEQIGTPEEVYLSPSSDFVGRLIGDPPINLVDGEVIKREGKCFFKVQDDLTFAIRDDLVSSMERVMWEEGGSHNVRVGIRPQHVKLSNKMRSDNSFQLPVYAVEHKADRSIVTFDMKDNLVIAQVEKGSCDTSKECWLEFDQDKLHFFKRSFSLSKK